MKELTFDIEKVSGTLRKWVIPITLVMFFPYVAMDHTIHTWSDWQRSISYLLQGDFLEFFQYLIKPLLDFFRSINNFLLVVLFFIAGIFIHEMIHGVVAALSADSGFQSVSFGFNKNTLTPYTHCNEIISMSAYRWILISPFLFTGLLPWIIAVAGSYPGMMAFSLLLTLGALGDIFMIIKTRKIKSSTRVKDHPEKLGLFIYDGN
jgi:hypothetical protein